MEIIIKMEKNISLTLNAFILCLIIPISVSPQKMFSKSNIFHLKGVEALNLGNINEAEKLFKNSILEFDYPPSYYQLGILYKSKGTVRGNIEARKYFENAILREPNNIVYRKELALIYENFSRKMAYDVYNDILKIDINNIDALFNLGRIKEEDFYEYVNSFFKEEGSPALSYNGFAMDDFQEAEKYYLALTEIEPGYVESYNHLAQLYLELGKPVKAISYLSKSEEYEPQNKETLLLLGICNYQLSRIDSSYSDFSKAINLMNDLEKTDYTTLSSNYFLSSNDFKNTDSVKVINNYWRSQDPLYLTSYNERLLEHYVRVAYSNFKFTVKKLDLPGWNTDRGEILIRYGIPENRIRFRPQISAGGNTSLMLKTDLWIYNDKVFGFTDDYWTGNYRFSVPNPSGRHHSQFGGDSETFIQDERRNEPENYTPKFNGPVIEVPYVISQFKSLANSSDKKTKLVVSFATSVNKSIERNLFSKTGFKAGIFLLNKDFELLTKKIKLLKDHSISSILNLGLNKDYNVNTIELDNNPDSLNFAFEIIRSSDNAVSTNHKPIKIKDFSDTEFEMSDILFCENVSKTETTLPLQRGNYFLLPNPLKTFVVTNKIYLYYEVYNLTQDENKISNFEQELKIERIDEKTGASEFINSILSSIGLTSKTEQLVLKTEYSTSGTTAQVYLQLDMKNYKKGKYKIQVSLKDKTSSKTISSQNDLIWK